MSVNDPISDMLTRIRNAGMARKSETTMPSTKVLVAIAKILKEEGYIGDFRVVEQRPQDQLIIALRYGADRKRRSAKSSGSASPVCESMPGKMTIPRVRSGLGIAIVSTPQGVMTGYEARRRGIGGEVLCTVF